MRYISIVLQNKILKYRKVTVFGKKKKERKKELVNSSILTNKETWMSSG